MNVCILTDNLQMLNGINSIIKKKETNTHKYHFYYSFNNEEFKERFCDNEELKPIDLHTCDKKFFDTYDVYISAHCKQLFPDILVENYRCINIHPGFNPYNRGWYPHVFSMINGMPIGITIHEIDCQIDHGPIIYRRKIDVKETDISSDIYKKIIESELNLLEEKLIELVEQKYTVSSMQEEGNVNTKKDFVDLCKLDMNSVGTFKEHLNILKALSFEGYDNAYFTDADGDKIYVSIKLKR